MELNELNEKCFMHDEIIKDIVYDKDSGILKMELKFCEWQLKELNREHVGVNLTFINAEQVLSYTNISQLLSDNNSIEFLNIKKNRGQKKSLLTFGLDHWVARDKHKNVADWFFIEFLCDECEIKYID